MDLLPADQPGHPHPDINRQRAAGVRLQRAQHLARRHRHRESRRRLEGVPRHPDELGSDGEQLG